MFMVKIKRIWDRQFSRGRNDIKKDTHAHEDVQLPKRKEKRPLYSKFLHIPILQYNMLNMHLLKKYKISRKHDVLSLFKKLIVKNITCSAGVFWAGELKLLVYVGIVVAAILDFMTEEHWGQ